jgi:hypothetical protein
MSPAWVCPACDSVIHFEDYERARLGNSYTCRTCGVALIIDRKIDKPVAAGGRPHSASSSWPPIRRP